MVRALVFDLDGVLVDAADWHYQALNQALGLFGYTISPSEHRDTFNGLPTRLKLQILSREKAFPSSLHGFVNEMKQKFTKDLFINECRPSPELTATLQELRKRGFKLAVASNSSRATVDLALERLGLKEHFDFSLSHEDVGRAKPDPEIYRECFRRLGLQPHETLILEDSDPGLRAARESYAPVFVVRNPADVTLKNILEHIRDVDRLTSPDGGPAIEIVVPMAGKGRRFMDAGFGRPKPFISVMGRPMIEWVVENVRPEQHPHVFTFLIAEDHLKNEAHASLLRRIAPGCRIVPVPSTTQGAACTALLASDVIESNRPLLIVNSDQYCDFSVDAFLKQSIESRCNGNILTFPATEEKWSYAKTNAMGLVVAVAEKEPISPHATVGIYYFKTAKEFQLSAEAMIRSDRRTRNEFYLCPVYNEVIRQGGNVRIFEIPRCAMHGLGTPEDLHDFLQYQLKVSEQIEGMKPN